MRGESRTGLPGAGQNNYAPTPELGISVASLNLYLNGNRTPPADFERRVTAALDRLEQAEQAAETARAFSFAFLGMTQVLIRDKPG